MPAVGGKDAIDIQSEMYESGQNSSSYNRDEGLLVLPVMGPVGTPPKRIRVHAPIGYRTVRWAYKKRATPPFIPSMADTPSGDIFLGGDVVMNTPDLGGSQNQLDFSAAGEYSYVQNVDNKGPRIANYNVQLVGGGMTNATNASPIVITTDEAHSLSGGGVVIFGVLGNTNANGTWGVTVIDSTSFSLSGSVGNGDYISGGRWNSLASNSVSDRGKFQTSRLPYFAPSLNAMILANGGTTLSAFTPFGTAVASVIGAAGAIAAGWVQPAQAVSANATVNDIKFADPNYKYYDSTISSLFFSNSLIL